MCDYDDCEPLVFRTYRVVKTRKKHRCNCCGQKWPLGSTMLKWSGVADGGYVQGYTCRVCNFMKDEPEGSKFHGCWYTHQNDDPAFDWTQPLWQEVRALLAERDAIHALV